MTGSRSPGAEEMHRRGTDDAVLRIYGPVAEQALAGARAVVDAHAVAWLRRHLLVGR